MPEAVRGMFSVDKPQQFSNDLCVGLRLELKPFASQELLDVLVVGDDTIVNNFMYKCFLLIFCVNIYFLDLQNHFSVHQSEGGS